MKSGLVLLFLTVCFASTAQAQNHKKLIYSNIDDNNTGWGSCTDYAGGTNNADVYWMAQFRTTPSLDGNSMTRPG